MSVRLPIRGVARHMRLGKENKMNELVTTLEVQAEIITKLRTEKNQLLLQVEQLKSQLEKLSKDKPEKK